jgi:hypothetical protein
MALDYTTSAIDEMTANLEYLTKTGKP